MRSHPGIHGPAVRASHAGALVLLATADERLRRIVCRALDAAGMRVMIADAGLSIDELAEQVHAVAVLLDLDADPAATARLLERMRERPTAPVIALSSRVRERDKVVALEHGADDYVTKPFGMKELVARIRVARRTAEARAQPAATIELGDLRIDPSRHQVTVEGLAVHVTPLELRVLVALARRRGRVVPRETLIRELWGTGGETNDPPLRVHIAKLRKKLGDDAACPRWLFTVNCVGYRLGDR